VTGQWLLADGRPLLPAGKIIHVVFIEDLTEKRYSFSLQNMTKRPSAQVVA